MRTTNLCDDRSVMWDLEGRRTSSWGRGYIAVHIPEHPKADKRGRVMLHRVVVENHIGRLLEDDEHVHHENEDPSDNRIENLELMTHSEHAGHHSRQRQKPNLVTVQCAQCGHAFERRQRKINGKRVFCSRSCSATYYGFAENLSGGRKPHAMESKPHGTYARYRRGCRCAECRTANAARIRANRQKRKVRGM